MHLFEKVYVSCCIKLVAIFWGILNIKAQCNYYGTLKKTLCIKKIYLKSKN